MRRVLCLLPLVLAADWPHWRGPAGDDPGDIVEQVWGGFADDSKNPRVKLAAGLFQMHKTLLAKRKQLGVDYGLGDRPQVPFELLETYAKQFHMYLRLPDADAAHKLDQKALIAGSDPDGGYTITPTMLNRVIMKQFESSNMRSLASVETIGGNVLMMPRDEGEFAFAWASEVASRSVSATSQIGMTQIPVYEWYALPKASQQLLEDSSWDIEGWIANKIGDVSGRGHETAFFSGNGTDRPRGFLTYPHGTTGAAIEQVPMLNASAITADGLLTLQYSLKDYYWRNAKWQMRRSSRLACRLLKDGNGRYLWEDSYKAGEPSSLLGYPVVGAEDMPAISAGTLPIAWGDWKQAYLIVNRLGISTIRDILTAKPHVLFYTRGRIGGDVVNFEAIKIGKVSAS